MKNALILYVDNAIDVCVCVIYNNSRCPKRLPHYVYSVVITTEMLLVGTVIISNLTQYDI